MAEQKEAALLLWMEGEEIRGRWSLSKPVTSIGRAETNDVVVDDRWVSRFHAQVQRDAGGYQVTDLDSKNGTFVNGRRITAPTSLSDGDLLQVAPLIKLTFVDYGSTAPLPGEVKPEPGLVLDRQTRQVWVRGRVLDPPLSTIQFTFLELLAGEPGRVFSRDEVIDALWPQDSAAGISDEAIDALVRRVRLRLREVDPQHEYIATVRGYGFRLEMVEGKR
jgi:predicted component of type VI protein secretion system